MGLLTHVAPVRVDHQGNSSQARGEESDRPARQDEVALHTGKRAPGGDGPPEQDQVSEPRRSIVAIRRDHGDTRHPLQAAGDEGAGCRAIRRRIAGRDDEEAHDQRR